MQRLIQIFINNIFKKLKIIFYSILKQPFFDIYLPLDEPLKILHISDIPSSYYIFVFRLIEKIKPDIVIHTGDLVDELKIEFQKKFVKEYKLKVKSFFEILNVYYEKKDFKKLLIVSGNHDLYDFLKSFEKDFSFLNVFNERAFLKLENNIFVLTHYPVNFEKFRIDKKDNIYIVNFKLNKDYKDLKYDFSINNNLLTYDLIIKKSNIHDFLNKHSYNKLKFSEEYEVIYLYGHNFHIYNSCKSDIKNDIFNFSQCKFYNGLRNPFLIFPLKKEVYKLHYPIGINEVRLMRQTRRISL